MKPEQPLTEMQLRFCEALAADPRGCLAAAARAAGYSHATAGRKGWQLINDPVNAHVKAYYDKLVEARFARYGITESKIIEGLAAIAFGDKREIVRWDPENGVQLACSSDQLFPEQIAQIKAIHHTESEFGVTPHVSFHSNLEALVALAKIRGMMRERTEVALDVRISTAAGRAASALSRLIERETQENPEEPAGGSSAG